MIDRRLVLMDPVDIHGLPHVELIDPANVHNGKRAAWAQPDFLPRDGAGILFLDEFPQSPPAMQNAASQLILDRQLGDYRLPDGWSVVAAGNNMTDRAATHRMPSHIANRFVHLDFESDQTDFTRHALAAKFRLEVIAFIQFRPELLHAFNAQERAFPTPRSWEFVSQVLDSQPSPQIEFDLYKGIVGQAAAVEFLAFVKIFRNLPKPDGILMDPDGAVVPTDPATMYATCGALAAKASASNFGAVTTYASRLQREFSVLLITASVKRCPDVQDTRAFVQWASDNADIQI